MNKIEPRGFITGTVIFVIGFAIAMVMQNAEMGILAGIAVGVNFLISAVKENTEAIRELPHEPFDSDRW